jgi:hypothetical protein
MYEVTQALTVSQIYEFFNNSAGQFGVFDKTNSAQPLTIRPLTTPSVSLGYSVNNASVNIGGTSGTGQSINLGVGGSGDIFTAGGFIFRSQGPAVFSKAIQYGRTAVNHASSPYTPSATTDYILGCDTSGGAITINLPALGWNGQTFIIKDETGNAGTNNITVNAPATHTLDGASSVVIGTNYGMLLAYSNGVNWNVFSPANLSTPADFPGSPTQFNTIGVSGRSARADHSHSTSGLMTNVAATSAAGYTLVNGTGTILSWTAPNDGALHRVMVVGTLHVTSAETGGTINVNFTAPDGTSGANQALFSASHGGGVFGPDKPGTLIVQAGTVVSVQQGSALTVGAAVLWAEIWAS